MEKPPFQFELKGLFEATAKAAVLMAIVHYVPAGILFFIGAVSLFVVLAVVISVMAGNMLSWLYLGISHRFRKRQSSDA